MIIAVLAGIVVAIAALFVMFSRHSKARKQRVIALGQELGLSPTNKIPLRFGTKLFDQGVYPEFHEPALEGTMNGRRVLLFDYSYRSGTDDNASTYFLTVVAFAFPEQDLPSFVLEKRSFLRRRIEIEGNLEFAKRFCVSGEDQAAIRSLFTPSLVNFLTSTELDKQKSVLEGAGNWLVFYRRTLPAEQCRSFLERTTQIAGGFSSHMGSLNSERSQPIAAGDAR